MGGRGSSSGIRARESSSGVTLNDKNARKLEDTAQFNEAKHYAYTRGAKKVEYTDSSGKIRKAETGRPNGGTYRISYSEEVANYAKMSTTELESKRSEYQKTSDENYQKFAHSAASKSKSQVIAFASADSQIKMINQVLRRRKK